METGIRVKDIMSKRVITIEEDKTILDAARKMVRGRASTVIVVKHGKPEGIVTDSDIIKKVVAKDKRASEVVVEDVMSFPLVTVPPDVDIAEAKRKMVENRIKRLPVVENGKVVGILTTTDIAMTGPEMISILKERIMMKEEVRPRFVEEAAGFCEVCGNYSENLKLINGQWLCENCRREI